MHATQRKQTTLNFSIHFQVASLSSEFLFFLRELLPSLFFPSFPAFRLLASFQSVRFSFVFPVFPRNGISFCFIVRLVFLPEVGDLNLQQQTVYS